MITTVLPTVLTLGALGAAQPLAAPLGTDTVELRFAPAEGSSLATDLRMAHTSDGGDLSCVMNGQEVPAQFLPDIQFSVDGTHELQVVDRFVAAPEDLADTIEGPWRLRTMDTAGQTFGMEMDMGEGPIEMTADGTTVLEGVTVGIGQTSSGDTVARWVDDEHPDDSHLDGLSAPLDLAGLLPEAAVEEGAAWKADASALAELLRPCGDLPWDWAGADPEEFPDGVAYTYDGELSLRFVEQNDADGIKVARIEIEGEWTVIQTDATDLRHVPVADGTATEVTTTTYAVEGELLWNLDASVMHSIEVEGKGNGTQVLTRDPDQDGPTYSSTTRHESEIKLTASVSVSVVD